MPTPVHSRLAPSSAHRWVECPASVKFLEGNAAILPKQDWSYADEGTRAHAAASALLDGKVGAFDSVEMAAIVDTYVKFVLDHLDEGDTLTVEQRVSLFYLPSQRGTMDIRINKLRNGKGLYFIDLKYGVGVTVEARENKQLAIYAESSVQELELIDDVPDETLVTLCIYQPRDRNNPEPVRLWVITRGELREFCTIIGNVANLILYTPDDAPAKVFRADPEKQCRFCPATGICKEYASHVLQVIPQAEADAGKAIVLPDPASLTREQRCNVIAMIDGLTMWMEAIKAQEMGELLNGAPPLTFKLVAGKSNRQWADEAAVSKLLGNYLSAEEKYSDPKLISPAQAEKILKGKETSTKFQNKLESLIVKPEGKPTLAPIADKRPALDLKPLSGLESIDVI